MKAIHTLIKPIVSEKASKQGEKFTYAFYVNRSASKISVKQAIKEVYGQDVEDVRIINTPSKEKVYKRSLVQKRAAMKKALVTLKGKKKLDVSKVTKESKK